MDLRQYNEACNALDKLPSSEMKLTILSRLGFTRKHGVLLRVLILLMFRDFPDATTALKMWVKDSANEWQYQHKSPLPTLITTDDMSECMTEVALHGLLFSIETYVQSHSIVDRDQHILVALLYLDILFDYERKHPADKAMDKTVFLLVFYHLHAQMTSLEQTWQNINNPTVAVATEEEVDANGERIKQCYPYWSQMLAVANTFRVKVREEDRKLLTIWQCLSKLRETQKELPNNVIVMTLPADDGRNKVQATRLISANQLFFVERPCVCYPVFPHACCHCYKRLPSLAGSPIICCGLCGAGYCSEACKDMALLAGHLKLCSGTTSGQQWQQIIQSIEVKHGSRAPSMIIAIQLMVKAECLSLISALKLPEIKIFRHCTDLLTNGMYAQGIHLKDCRTLRYLLRDLQYRFPAFECRNLNLVDFTILDQLLQGLLIPIRDQTTQVLHSGLFPTVSFIDRQLQGYNAEWNAPLQGSVCDIGLFALRNILKGEEIIIS
jgi:hypothetical protein